MQLNVRDISSALGVLPEENSGLWCITKSLYTELKISKNVTRYCYCCDYNIYSDHSEQKLKVVKLTLVSFLKNRMSMNVYVHNLFRFFEA